MELSSAVAALTALAQETRLAIFRVLVEEGPDGLTAGQIAARLGVPTSTLSFHLGQLRQGAMVSAKRAGRLHVYAAQYGTMDALLVLLAKNCCGGDPTPCEPYPAIRALRRCA